MMERGLALRIRVHGASMAPMIRSGDVVTLVPLAGRRPQVGDVLACVLPGPERLVLHRLVAAQGDGWLLKGDNCVEADGTITLDGVLGSVSRVERNGRDVRFGGGRASAGIARLSRAGGLRFVFAPRRVFYRAASGARQAVQSLAVYRSLGRRLGPRIGVEEASACDISEAAHAAGRSEAALPPHECPPRRLNSWAAKHHGALVGFAQVSAVDEAYGGLSGWWLSGLWVKGRYRGLGIGEALVARAVEDAGLQGATSLRIAVFKDNAAALGLLRKSGFADAVVAELEPGYAAEQQLCGRRRIVLERPAGTRGV
jgi:ribosomal protein S18 acetylase RimI-like enzyme